MANRFLITGVQLGMLISQFDRNDSEAGKELIYEILNNQHVGRSDKIIDLDVQNIINSGLINENGGEDDKGIPR